jgi:hypothetical protein
MWPEGDTEWNEAAAVAAEPLWADAETNWNLPAVDTLSPDAQWGGEQWRDPNAPVIENVEPDPSLDLLDLAPESTQDEMLDVQVEVAPPEGEPEPDPEPPPPNKTMRLGGGRFRPNRNRR